LTLLDVRAVYAEPKRPGSTPAPAPFNVSYADSTCLFHLGDDKDFSVLYNVNSGSVLRYPANLAALETRASAPPARCDATTMSVEGGISTTTGEW
jgi:hypothetical protein